MKKSLDIYKCKLVREKTIEYLGSMTCSHDVINAIKKLGFAENPEEHFGVFGLNVKGEIVGYHEVSHGDLCSTSCGPKEVFKRAILNNCAAIICVHNHPSGDATPSNDDLTSTKRIEECGKLLGIKLVDHIIVGSSGNHFSMKAEGILF